MCRLINQKIFLAVASAASRLEMAMAFAVIIISSEKSRIGIEATYNSTGNHGTRN